MKKMYLFLIALILFTSLQVRADYSGIFDLSHNDSSECCPNPLRVKITNEKYALSGSISFDCHQYGSADFNAFLNPYYLSSIGEGPRIEKVGNFIHINEEYLVDSGVVSTWTLLKENEVVKFRRDELQILRNGAQFNRELDGRNILKCEYIRPLK